ncbi:MAG TPA: hypothetical protein DEG71_08085 [Clostridiales bacterium]|nr:hypothetical protein [Clostridiales bacterium]
MKVLKLESLQTEFAGTITKNGAKYDVTYPNSTKVFSFKCNLKALAERLHIQIADVDLADKNVYTEKYDKVEIARQNNEMAWNLVISNRDKIPQLIKELAVFAQTQDKDTVLKNSSSILFADINIKKQTIEFITFVSIGHEELKKKANHYYWEVCTLSNGRVAGNLDNLINRVLREFGA